MKLALPATIGHYRIGHKIGEGGMGEVYLAEQEQPFRRTVALKVVKWGAERAEVIKRFRSEQPKYSGHPAAS